VNCDRIIHLTIGQVLKDSTSDKMLNGMCTIVGVKGPNPDTTNSFCSNEQSTGYVILF